MFNQDEAKYAKGVIVTLPYPTDDVRLLTRVMAVLDQINARWGRGTLRAASVPSKPDWGMRREMMSQSYTIRLDQLWRLSCH